MHIIICRGLVFGIFSGLVLFLTPFCKAQSPRVILNGESIMTNECHVLFDDPGARSMALPKAIAAGDFFSLALKFDGTVIGWGGSGTGETSIPAGLSNVVAIAAGGYHGLALKSNGTVVGWGRNYEGEATPPSDLSNVVAIAAKDFFSVALKSNGTVVVWGWSASVPPGLSDVKAIAGGLALKNDGTVVALDGTSIPGGLNSVIAISSKLAVKSDGTVIAFDGTIIPLNLSNVVAVSSGLYNDLTLKNDGTVVGIGNNIYGQASGLESLTNVIAIAAGGYHSLAVTSDTNVIGAGYNTYGQTSVPDNFGGNIVKTGSVDYNNPGVYTLFYTATNSFGSATVARTVVVIDSTPPSLALSGNNPLTMPINTAFLDPGATALDSCAGNLTSSILVVGNVNTSFLGTNTLVYSVTDPSGNTTSITRTVIVVGGSPFATTLAASRTNQSVTLYGTVNPNGISTLAWFEWGTNILHGNSTAAIALGSGSANVPISISLTGLTAGVTYHYRIVATNIVGCSFGRDAIFQNLPRIIHVPPLMLSGANALTNNFYSPFIDPGAFVIAPLIDIAAGEYYSLALKSDSTVAAWGNIPHPPSDLSNVTAIAAGYIHSLALKADGTIVGWGDNNFGETNIPADLSNVVAVSSGWGFSLGLKSDGTVVGWGLGATNPPAYDGLNFGQANVPTNLNYIVAISAGFDSSLALKSDGTVVSWGYPQPYNGSSFPNFVGVTPPNDLSNVIAIATGAEFGLALKSNGTVVGWGYNGEGQVSIPYGLSNVVAIATGFYHSLALKSDGTVAGWGDDFYGEATPPPDLTNVIAIAAGAYHSLALKSDGTVVGWGLDAYGETDITTAGMDLITPVPANGAVNVNQAGIYLLTYTATNSAGDSSLSRTVTVLPPPPPTIAITISTNEPTNIPTLTIQSLAAGHIEVSTNLTDWNAMANFIGTNSEAYFFDLNSTNSSLRFYRAVIP